MGRICSTVIVVFIWFSGIEYLVKLIVPELSR